MARGMCMKGVNTGHNEDGMGVDGSTSTIGGGAADDAGRCDGRGREGWEAIMMHTLSRCMSVLAITQMIKSAPACPLPYSKEVTWKGSPPWRGSAPKLLTCLFLDSAMRRAYSAFTGRDVDSLFRNWN